MSSIPFKFGVCYQRLASTLIHQDRDTSQIGKILTNSEANVYSNVTECTHVICRGCRVDVMVVKDELTLPPRRQSTPRS